MSKGCEERSDFFFFNDSATTEIYTLSLHDALPIFFTHRPERRATAQAFRSCVDRSGGGSRDDDGMAIRCGVRDRKSTRLNSSHANISYAVFCLKKKKIMSLYKRITNKFSPYTLPRP